MVHFPAFIRFCVQHWESHLIFCAPPLCLYDLVREQSENKIQWAGERQVICHFRGQTSHIALNLSQSYIEKIYLLVIMRAKLKHHYPHTKRSSPNFKDWFMVLPFHKSHSFVLKGHGNHHTLQWLLHLGPHWGLWKRALALVQKSDQNFQVITKAWQINT